MNKNWKGILFFVSLGIIAAAAIVTSSRLAQPRIDESLTEKAKAQMQKMLPQGKQEYSTFVLLAPNYLKMGDTQTGVRVLEGDKPIQIIFTGLSEKAYQSKIGVMASFDLACTVLQVEILSEKETPGLGDQYQKNDRAWLKSLAGKTAETVWALKPKGEIDSWTGATVTPQAIVKTISRMQALCVDEHDLLFGNEPLLYLEMGKPDER